jgi:hypothetical protein
MEDKDMADIAPHWTHERLTENLRAASRAQTIDAAASEWMLRDTGDIRDIQDASAQQEIRCQLCNHVILRYAAIANTVNEAVLIIGLDCLRKLVAFLESGSIRAPLRDGAANRAHLNALISALRDSLTAESDRELRTQLSNKTVLGWFEEELEAKRLPEDIARLVRLVSLDVLPSPTDAERLVEHYKAHRLLPIEVLVPPSRLRLLARFRRLLPALIPIAALPRVLALTNRAQRLAEDRRKNADLAFRRQLLETQLAKFRHRGLLPENIPDGAIDRALRMVDRDRVLAARLRLPTALAELDRLLAKLRAEIPGADWYLTTDVERLRREVAVAADQPPSYTHEAQLRRVNEWLAIVARQLACPTVHVYVDMKPVVPTVFSREDGSWQHRQWYIHEGHRPTRTGVYTARLVTGQDLLALTETTESGPIVAVMALDTPLDHSPFGGRYRGHGGRDGDRWIIPTPRPLWRAGTYRCLVLREADDHVLVYPLARARTRRTKGKVP